MASIFSGSHGAEITDCVLDHRHGYFDLMIHVGGNYCHFTGLTEADLAKLHAATAPKQPHPLCDYPAEECDHDWGQPGIAEATCKKCGSSVPF